MLGVFPKYTGRKAWQARERMAHAFIEYFKNKGYEDSSELTLGRFHAQRDHGATIEDIARLEVSEGLGILSNTVPTCFWVLYDIYSRPDLLKELRDELRANAITLSPDGTHTIDLVDIKEKCGLLISTFQEVLRVRSIGAPTRTVYKDILLNDQYLLKKGSLLMMPIKGINREENTWGAQAHEFNPRRFADGRQKDIKVTGFMSFG